MHDRTQKPRLLAGWREERNGAARDILEDINGRWRRVAWLTSCGSIYVERACTPGELLAIAEHFILDTLAKALGVTEYAPCDGTETWEGDVSGTVYRILHAARVLNDENQVARHAG